MKMISIDDLIEYCNSEITAYKANNCGAACTALRRLVEFAKENVVEAEPIDRWISVKDRLPENRNQVMVYGLVDSIFQYGVKDEICIIGRYRKDYHSWWFPVKIDLKVTHWQPLPEPPKGE